MIKLRNVSVEYKIKKINFDKKKIHHSNIDKNIHTNSVKALHNINLEIKNNTRVGVFGPNGSGKSTLLKVMAGVIPPTNGLIETNGDITFVGTSDFSFIGNATGEENSLLYLMLKNNFKEDYNETLNHIQKISGLGKFFYNPTNTYSSGMKIRLAYACTEVVKSEIMILDEWLSLADQNMREHIYSSLKKKINNTKITVLASHNLNILRENCDKIVYLMNGYINDIEIISQN